MAGVHAHADAVRGRAVVPVSASMASAVVSTVQPGSGSRPIADAAAGQFLEGVQALGEGVQRVRAGAGAPA